MPMKIMSHFSQIDVESKLGEGTTFTITLPCDILATPVPSTGATGQLFR